MSTNRFIICVHGDRLYINILGFNETQHSWISSWTFTSKTSFSLQCRNNTSVKFLQYKLKFFLIYVIWKKTIGQWITARFYIHMSMSMLHVALLVQVIPFTGRGSLIPNMRKENVCYLSQIYSVRSLLKQRPWHCANVVNLHSQTATFLSYHYGSIILNSG